MLRWAPYPFVRIALSFIAGILLYIFWGEHFGLGSGVLAFFAVLYQGFYLVARKRKRPAALDAAGIAGLLCFVATGLWVAQLHDASKYENNLQHLPAAPTYYKGVVEDYVVQKPGYQSTVLQVQQAKVHGVWQRATGKVQISVPHDSGNNYELVYGDVLFIKGAPEPVAPPANPGQFNYKTYLAHKNIYYRHYLKASQFQKTAHEPPVPVLYYSIKLRRQLDQTLRQRIDQRREYSIAAALVLGVKDELDNAVRQAYAGTGTMHVLAVSGLHVGLIYGLLMLLFGQMNFSRRLRVVQALAVLFILWGYAFVTGLSPSVLRAVLMFSLVTVGLAINRRTNIYNTIAFAATVLLLFNPYNLLEVSFQLSFLAVLGIVYLQPRLYSLFEFQNWLLDKVWALFTVAVAAQVATLPLGLYYFHQFPMYFWLANILVVPLATLVLYATVLALALSWVPVLSALLFQGQVWLTYAMNSFNLWVQQWPHALISGIDVTAWQVLLLYGLLILFALFFSYKRLRYLALAVVVVALLSAQATAEVLTQKQQRKLVAYHVRGATGIAVIEGQQAVILADSALLSNPSDYTFNMQPNLWQHGITEPAFTPLTQTAPKALTKGGAVYTVLADGNSLMVWQGQRLLVLTHKPQSMNLNTPALDYILLRNNVRLKPADLQHYTFRKVLLDASNSPWYRKRMHQQLNALGLPYHDIADTGAFVLDLE